MNEFSIVKCDNKISLEKTDIFFRITYEQCLEYHKFFKKRLLKREKKVYDEIEKVLDQKIFIANKSKDFSSRRIIYVRESKSFSSTACTTSVHLLSNRSRNKLEVYQRSISSQFFISDISFFIALCIKYRADLSIFIGSFHFII